MPGVLRKERSGFRLQAPASLTPAKRLNYSRKPAASSRLSASPQRLKPLVTCIPRGTAEAVPFPNNLWSR